MTVTSAAAGTDTNGRGVSLELIGLSRRFGPVIALDDLTFSALRTGSRVRLRQVLARGDAA